MAMGAQQQRRSPVRGSGRQLRLAAYKSASNRKKTHLITLVDVVHALPAHTISQALLEDLCSRKTQQRCSVCIFALQGAIAGNGNNYTFIFSKLMTTRLVLYATLCQCTLRSLVSSTSKIGAVGRSTGVSMSVNATNIRFYYEAGANIGACSSDAELGLLLLLRLALLLLLLLGGNQGLTVQP
jgi:hypothetical protein